MEKMNQKEIELVDGGKRIAAIRSYRNRTGATLKYAKELTEDIVPMCSCGYDEEQDALCLQHAADKKRKEEQDGEHILQEVLDWVHDEIEKTDKRLEQARSEHDRNHLPITAAALESTNGYSQALSNVRKMLVIKMKEVK